MPFDWRGYLALAQSLHQGSAGINEEAAWRSAVSRAYYAAFCHVRNHARDHEGFAGTGDVDDHVRLRDHLHRQDETKLAQELGKLRGWRNQCDYRDEVHNLAAMVGAATATAQAAIDRV